MWCFRISTKNKSRINGSDKTKINTKSTLPDTESILPDIAIRSPKLIYLLNLFNWLIIGKSLVIILIIKRGKQNR